MNLSLRPVRKVVSGARLTARVTATLWPYMKNHKGILTGSVAISLLTLALRLAQPWPLKFAFDALTSEWNAWKPFTIEPAWALFAVLSAVYLAFSIGAALSERGQIISVSNLANRSVYSFREQLFLRAMSLPLSFHERRSEGEMLTRLIYDTQRLRRGVIGILLRAFRSVVLFFAIVGLLLWIDAALAAIVLACGLLGGTMMLFRGSSILSAAKTSRKREGQLADAAEENLQGVREMQTYRTPGELDPRFEKYNRRSLKTEMKIRRLEAGLLFMIESSLAVALCLILYFGASRVAVGTLTPGDLVLFLSYLLALKHPFSQFARQAAQTGRTVACAKRLLKIMEQVPAVADRPDAVAAPDFQGAIEFQGVTAMAPMKARGSRSEAIRDASFRIEPGERVALMGPNGSGKSTLLRHILRLADPTEGRVLIDGRDLRDYTIASLRAQMSVVYQDAILFGWSVRDNISMGRPNATEEEIRAAVRHARIREMVEGLPDKYDTKIRRRGRLFSNGERQRVAVARAWLRDGRIWLLDEPGTALDAETDAGLAADIAEVTRGRTTVWVTHRLPPDVKMDRVLYLEKGQVRFFGTPEAFHREFRKEEA